MAKPEGDKNRIELVQGTLDMLILQTLRWGSHYRYGIGQAIPAGSGEVLQVETCSLYPALHRLEKHGWIKSEWRPSEHNQHARYDPLTASGKTQLAGKYIRWNQLSAAIAGLMNPGKSEGQAWPTSVWGCASTSMSFRSGTASFIVKGSKNDLGKPPGLARNTPLTGC